MLRAGPTPPPNLQLRIRGAVLGAVLGDAFGAPFEGASPGAELTRAVHERDGAIRHWGYTDDGEMAIGFAESLVERRGFEAEHVLATLAERQEPARGYGSGTLRVFRAFQDGAGIEDAATASREGGSAGNGAAVRVAPLAALLHADPAALAIAAASSARLTHAAPDAIAAAVVQAVVIGALVRGTPPSPVEAFLTASSSAPDAAPARQALESLSRLLAARASHEEAAKSLGTRPLAMESVPFALFCFLRDPSRHETLLEAVASGGDTDSIGSLVGALLGAANGAGVFPRQWVHNLENSPRGRDAIIDLADALLEIATA